MKGLAPHTQQVFGAASKLECIKSYILILYFKKWNLY